MAKVNPLKAEIKALAEQMLGREISKEEMAKAWGRVNRDSDIEVLGGPEGAASEPRYGKDFVAGTLVRKVRELSTGKSDNRAMNSGNIDHSFDRSGIQNGHNC